LIYSGLNAIKELDEENQDLKDKVAALEIQVENSKILETRVDELEKILAQLIDEKKIDDLGALAPTNGGETTSYLNQNQPNPLYISTDIEYQLPDNKSIAYILIQDLNGQTITRFDLQKSNKGKITFNAQQYGISSGTYIYSLIVNEIVIESKKMIFIE